MKITSPVRQQQSSTSAPPAAAEELLSPRTACIVAAVLVAGVFAIYSPSLNFQFILDDHRFLGDPRLQSPGHVREYFTTYVWAQVPGGPLSFYRPLFVLWLRLNFIFSGMSSWGWHLLSVVKHLSVAALLGWLAWKLLRDRVAALLAAALFVLHPAHTESVAWVTVPDPLMSAAVLATLLLFLRYAEHAPASAQSYSAPSHKQPRKQPRGKSKTDSSAAWLIASAVACLAALLAKETAIVLPVMLFALALVTPPDKPRAEEAANGESAGLPVRLLSAFRQTLPFLGVTLAYLLLRFSALKGQLSSATQHLPWTTVLLTWPATLWFYVTVLFWPVRSRAFADPDLVERFSLRGVVFPCLGVCGVAALLVCLCLWARRTARRDLSERQATGVDRALLLGSLLLVLPLLPVLNVNVLNPGDFLHGRYTYLPLTGLTLLLTTAWRLAKNRRIVLLSVGGLVALAFALLTVQQESAWADDLTVFTVAHEIAPHNAPVAQNLARAHVQAALALADAGRCDEALPIFEQAIQQYQQDWFAWAGRGECLFKQNDLQGAEQSLRRASDLSHEPRVTEQWQQLRTRMGLPATPLD
jgi:protein O-mannosyl-transferase